MEAAKHSNNTNVMTPCKKIKRLRRIEMSYIVTHLHGGLDG